MSLPFPSPFPKRCTCCTRVYSEEQWSELPALGPLVNDWEALELRNCACGSTLAVLMAVFQLEAA